MIFIDTGAFLARYLKSDQYHQRAVIAWKDRIDSREKCFTSDFVLDETLTLLSRRAGSTFAAERARAFYESQTLSILRPDEEDELGAVALLEKYADQQIGFTDCVSFALMQKRGLRRVFTFDHHFEIAGFQKWPESD